MTQATKEKLREKLIAKRQKLSKQQVEEISSIIAVKCLEAINWKDIKNINVYSSITKLREPDPQPLITAVQRGLPFIKVTKQSISRSSHPKTANKYDLVIVPVLGFDKRCNRLGWGGGFYDRFLKLQSSALKVGLAYEASKVDKLPHEPHDVAMDMIITEEKVYKNDSNSI